MKLSSLLVFFLFSFTALFGQFDSGFGGGTNIKLNEDGSHYMKFTLTNQIWSRYNQSNPGTTVEGTPKSETFDIGIRRSRIQMMGALNDRSFIYIQAGMNNINHLSDRKQGLFFHDVIAEYSLVKKHLSIGGGLTNWVGLSRISNASIVTFMTMDSPLFPFATIDATDQFNRKLSLYAKGKIGKLDYRLELTDPMNIEKSSLYSVTNPISLNSSFAPGASNKQFQGYFMYQFWDQESNLTPYLNGTYLGTKRVFNLGGGFVHQHNAMWRQTSTGDTVKTDLSLFALDAFLDMPLNKDHENAITVYCSVFFNNYGDGYLRNLGVMNPATGVLAGTNSFNGTGNAYPIFGNGNVYYAQAGYLFGKKIGQSPKLRIQPYFAYMLGDYNRLGKAMQTTNLGLNLFLNKHNSKITFDWQQRPIYQNAVGGILPYAGTRNCFTMQFQVAI